MSALRIIILVAVAAPAACYRPDLRNCAVTCRSAADCPRPYMCTAEGFCGSQTGCMVQDGGADQMEAGPDREATCWDPAADFSTTVNPVGPWTYGSDVSGSFVTLDRVFSDDAPMIAWYGGTNLFDFGMVGKNTSSQGLIWAETTFVPAGGLVMHPGDTFAAGGLATAVLRWHAPRAGRYSIAGVFQGVSVAPNPPTTTDVHVVADGQELAATTINADGAGNELPFALEATVPADGVIDFKVGIGTGTGSFDLTGVSARICEKE